MSQINDGPSPRRGTTEANVFVALLFLVAICCLAAYLFPVAQRAIIPLIYALPFVLVLAVVNAYRLARLGTAWDGIPALGFIRDWRTIRWQGRRFRYGGFRGSFSQTSLRTQT